MSMFIMCICMCVSIFPLIIYRHEQKSMESFQKQHKMIEEQNKLKREKLSKAIKERLV